MATRSRVTKWLKSSPFNDTSLKWITQRVVFHNKRGRNAQCFEDNTVVSNQTGCFGIVSSSQPIPIGQMFKVTVMQRGDRMCAIFLGVGFIGKDPKSSDIHQTDYLSNFKDNSDLVFVECSAVKYKGEKIHHLGFKTSELEAGQSIGILLSEEGDLYWFRDDKCYGVVHIKGFLHWNRPLWGVIEVSGECRKIKAEIKELYIDREKARAEGPNGPEKIEELSKEVQLLKERIRRYKTEVKTATESLADLCAENQILLRVKSSTESTVVHSEICQVVHKEKLIASAEGENNNEFWQVEPEEVVVQEDQILGRGAWGYVAKGIFRGTTVAIKVVHASILASTTFDRVRREIRTMAQIRHPNLVLFIAAVLSKQKPLIVIELLDTSLREASQKDLVGTNKRRIFGDISSALVYLHLQKEPIIHRDVSTSNVLLASLPNNAWMAKLSDFGSANLVRYAMTPGEGAILYAAPESYPLPPNSTTTPPPQSAKIDVYSFGVLACEVITRALPDPNTLNDTVEIVHKSWPQIYAIVRSCIERSARDRPTMMQVRTELSKLDNEPIKPDIP